MTAEVVPLFDEKWEDAVYRLAKKLKTIRDNTVAPHE